MSAKPRLSSSEQHLELSVQGSLEDMGLFLLSEWDVLGFVYSHGTSLITVDRIACLVGYEAAVVGATLDRLEREGLIERSRTSQGACLYRIRAPMDPARRLCLHKLFNLSERRAGRMIFSKLMMPVRNRGEKKNPEV